MIGQEKLQTQPVDKLEIGLNPFSINDYLIKRQNDPNFVMVEAGHDSVPVAYQQPSNFYGQRAYIGIESWIRDPWNVKREQLNKLHNAYANGQNVFYVTHNLGGKAYKDPAGNRTYFDGEYEAATVLPDSIASEVFLSNVFCDPVVAQVADRVENLLTEVTRLVDQNGVIVLRETLTPDCTYYFTNDLMASKGLECRAIIRPTDTQTWNDLETLYSGKPYKWLTDVSTARYEFDPIPQSYYLFLSKI